MKLFLFLILLSACAHDKILDASKNYRKTLNFSVNNEYASGTHSAKKKNSYHIEISTAQKPNLVKITSCHQEKVFIKPGKDLEFTYRPNLDIEANNLPCIIEISVLEESGKNQWGLIDFQLDSEQLTAKISCSGIVTNTKGSYICQSREGLIQEVEFDKEVSALTSEECNKIESEDRKKFFYQTSEGMCFYLFADNSGQMYRLITFGYNDMILDD